MDKIDIRILLELKRDGRLSNKALASRVSLSPSACLDRVRKLQASGAIAGFTTNISRGWFARIFEGWITTSLPHRGERDIERLAGLLRDCPFVVDAYELAGPCDVLLRECRLSRATLKSRALALHELRRAGAARAKHLFARAAARVEGRFALEPSTRAA